LPLLARSWSPKGQTPIVIEQAGRLHLSLIAAIAPNGRIYVAGQDQPFSGVDIVWFLSQLYSRYRKRDLLVIWDGAAIHRSKSVKELLQERPGRMHLERLPAYSPNRTADAAQPRRIGLEPPEREFEESSIYQLRRTNDSDFRASQTNRKRA
jgi:hypothetical protein